MRITAVDERSSTWEAVDGTFRVYFFSGDPEVDVAFGTSTYDVDDADVLEVISWAATEAGSEKMFAVALVCPPRGPGDAGQGLQWLVGMDANDHPKETLRLERIYRRMVARRGRQYPSS